MGESQKKLINSSALIFISAFSALILVCLLTKLLLPQEKQMTGSLLSAVFASTVITCIFYIIQKKYLSVAERLKSKLNDETKLLEALKKSEEKYRAIFDCSAQGIVLVDITRSVPCDFNEAILSILGYSSEEFSELNFKNIESTGYDNIRLLLDKKETELFTSKKTISFKTKFNTKSGVPVDLEVSARKVPLADKDYLLLICKDISSESYMQKALTDQALFANTLLEVNPMPIFYKNRDGRYLGCNAAFEKFTGFKRDKIIGKTVFDIAAKEIADEYFKKDEELFKNPGTQIYDWKVKRSDGEIREVIFNKATYTDKKGNVIGLIGTITDVTEIRKKNRELILSYEKWQDTFDAFNDMIFIVDRDYKIIMSNKAVKKNFFGEFVDGNICHNIIHACNMPIDDCPLKKIFEDGKDRSIDVFNPLLNRYFEVAFYPLKDHSGHVLQVIHVMKDITDRKKAEHELIRSRNILLSQNRALVKWISPELLLTLPIDIMIKEVLKECSSTLKTSLVSVWFFDSKKEKITCAFEYDSRKDHFKTGEELFVKDHPLYFEAILKDKIITADNSHTDPGTIDLLEKYLIPKGITSMMDALLSLGKDPLGIICCEHTGEPRNWTIEETNYLISIAGLVSIYFLASKNENIQKILDEQINRFQQITANSDIGLMVIDDNKKVIYVNKSCEIFFGEKIKNILGSECPPEIYDDKKTKKIPIQTHGGEKGTAIVSCENCKWEGKNAKLLTIKDITLITK